MIIQILLFAKGIQHFIFMMGGFIPGSLNTSFTIPLLQIFFMIGGPKKWNKLEDLKVLRRSPDLLNNVKIGQGQLQLIMEQILFYHIWGLQTFWSSDLNNLMNNPSNSPVISEKQMLR